MALCKPKTAHNTITQAGLPGIEKRKLCSFQSYLYPISLNTTQAIIPHNLNQKINYYSDISQGGKMKKCIFNTGLILLSLLLFTLPLTAEDRASGFAIFGPLRVSTIMPPDFSLPGGSYQGSQTITLHTFAGSGAKIRYTTNNIAPTTSYGNLYALPIVISQNTTIKAIVYLEGVAGSQSLVASETYTISYQPNIAVAGPLRVSTIMPPSFSLEGGEYQGTQSLALSSGLGANARIRYTLDGSEPTMYSGILYHAPIMIDQNTTVKAITYLNGVSGSASIVKTELYRINNTTNVILSFDISFTENPVPITSFELKTDFLYSFQKVPINNQIQLQENELASIFSFCRKIKRINLYSYNTLVAHIDFEYTKADYNSGRKYQVQLFIHGTHQPYTSGWEYYSANERMLSMLVEPDFINVFTKPMLLVHGVGGSFPYFDRDFILKLNGNPNTPVDDINDIWEFYYPYDQHIERSAPLLANAIQNIRQHYPQGSGSKRVNLIAHSMGGLVSRYYIQNCPNEDTGIQKFLMLGTPNHGSHSSFRISSGFDYPVSKVQNEVLINVDEKSPAVRQMYPGSPFLRELNAQTPRNLYPDSVIAKDYLVVAGTKNEVRTFLPDSISGWEHYLPSANDDIVVSTASASLLDKGIPLALVPFNHQSMCGNVLPIASLIISPMHPGFLSAFFESNYNPNANPFGSSVNAFYLNTTNDNALPSLLQIEFNHDLGSQTIFLDKDSANSLSLKFIKDEDIENIWEDDRIYMGLYANTLRKCDAHNDKSYYFMEQTTLHTALFQSAFMKYGMGANLNNGTYDLKLYNKKNKLFLTIPSALQIKKLSTAKLNIDLRPAEVAHCQLDNTNASQQTRRFRDGNRSLIEKEYYVDASANTTIFYLGDEEAGDVFANHALCLIDPLQNEIYPAIAISNPDIEYKEDLASGFAYFYVNNPLPGIWKLRYNEALSEDSSESLIDSPLNIQVELPEHAFAAGDILPFSLPLPLDADYDNPLFTVQLAFTDSTATSYSLGNIPLSLNLEGSAFTGNIQADYPGTYHLEISFSCQVGSNTVQRFTERSISVQNAVPPLLHYPEDMSLNMPPSLQFKWGSQPNAQAYHLLLFNKEQTEPLFSVSLADTLYQVENLSFGEEYYWQISSESAFGSSTSSPAYSFKTIYAAPELLYPPDAAENQPQTLQVAWEALTGLEAYELQLSSDPYFDDCIFSQSGINQNTYEFSGLSSMESYYWRVRAKSDTEQGEWSIPFSFSIRPHSILFPESFSVQENSILQVYLQDYIDDFDPGLYALTVSGNVSLELNQYPERLVFTPPAQWYGSEEVLLQIYELNSRGIKNTNHFRDSGYPIHECNIVIHVWEVNDLPELLMDTELLFWDTEESSLDLAPYLYDPDNSLSEIQLEVIAGAYLDVYLQGHQLVFQAPPGWQGSDIIEIRLSNLLPRQAKRQENSASYNSYFLHVTLVDATPQFKQISSQNGNIRLKWNAIPGAESYRIFSAMKPTQGFEDISALGQILSDSDGMSWLAPLTNPRSFYYIKAVKAEPEINRQQMINKDFNLNLRGSK